MFKSMHEPRIINSDTIPRRIPVLAVAVTAAVGLTGVMAPHTAHAYASRSQIDGNVRSFQALDQQHAFVLGSDGRLWAENGPWGTVPPSRSPVDANVVAFQALDGQHAYVLGTDGRLWEEYGPWGSVPPSRSLVDAGVSSFQALDGQHAYVLGTDARLWDEKGPWGSVPPSRSPVDANVYAFQALDNQHAYVLGTDGRLWAENGPWGSVPPSRSLIDAGVKSVRGLSTLDGHRYVFFVRTDLTLWCAEMEPSHAGASPAAVDGNVVAFQPVDVPASAGADALVDVLGTDGKLWQEIVKLPV
jgi:hypothetical protein